MVPGVAPSTGGELVSARRISGVFPVRADALDIVRRVSWDEHPYTPLASCLGCELAAEWRRLYEGAGVPVERYARDPFNTGGDAS